MAQRYRRKLAPVKRGLWLHYLEQNQATIDFCITRSLGLAPCLPDGDLLQLCVNSTPHPDVRSTSCPNVYWHGCMFQVGLLQASVDICAKLIMSSHPALYTLIFIHVRIQRGQARGLLQMALGVEAADAVKKSHYLQAVPLPSLSVQLSTWNV